MTSNKIKFITNESHDWQIIGYEDFTASGHEISTFNWIGLLNYLGYEIEYEEISDEKMEEIC